MGRCSCLAKGDLHQKQKRSWVKRPSDKRGEDGRKRGRIVTSKGDYGEKGGRCPTLKEEQREGGGGRR